MEHTKGPWKTHPYFEAVTGPNGEFICLTVKPGMTPKAHTEPNCKLIAAAPDLLHELTELLDTFKSILGGSDPLYYEDFKDDIERAQRIIDKAKNGLG